MNITILLAVCTIISININGSIGISSAFDSSTPIIKRVSLSKSKRFATNINSNNHENDANIQQQCNKLSNVFTNRRSFVSSSSVTIASTILPNLNANADELNNLHYKSKADGDDDPLVVFGKSLEDGTNSSNSSDVSSSTKDTSLSFSDISLPSTDDAISSPPPDLSKALKERKDSQKRSVDPRTHG